MRNHSNSCFCAAATKEETSRCHLTNQLSLRGKVNDSIDRHNAPGRREGPWALREERGDGQRGYSSKLRTGVELFEMLIQEPTKAPLSLFSRPMAHLASVMATLADLREFSSSLMCASVKSDSVSLSLPDAFSPCYFDSCLLFKQSTQFLDS